MLTCLASHSVPLLELGLFLVSFLAGGFGALVGLGGGVLLVPAMVILFGFNIHYAIGASIVSVIATSSGAAAAYVRDHITNIRVAILLEVATTLGALGGAALSTKASPHFLYLLFSTLLLISAGMMVFVKRKEHSGIRSEKSTLERYLRLDSSYPDRFLGREISYVVTRVPLGFLLMLAAGLLSGLLGIGSGVLKVPAMDTAMGLPMKVSSATSNFMIGVTAAASAGPYLLRGNILPILAAPVALGVLTGSWVGARWMNRIGGATIRWIFVGTLLVVAVEMALKAFGVSLG